MPTSLLVGIDVSSCENKVRFLDSLGISLSKFTVPNNQTGATKLSQKIAGVMASHKLDSLVIGLEATSVYGEPLVHFLKQDAVVNSYPVRPHQQGGLHG